MSSVALCQSLVNIFLRFDVGGVKAIFLSDYVSYENVLQTGAYSFAMFCCSGMTFPRATFRFYINSKTSWCLR